MRPAPRRQNQQVRFERRGKTSFGRDRWCRPHTRREGCLSHAGDTVVLVSPSTGEPLSRPIRTCARARSREESALQTDDGRLTTTGCPSPRHCPSFERDTLTGRRSSNFIRARGKDYAAPKGRIDDCKPTPSLIIKTTCNQGASIDGSAMVAPVAAAFNAPASQG